MLGPTRELDIAAGKARQEVRLWRTVRAAKHALRTTAANGSITLTGGMLAHRPQPGAPLVTAGAHMTEGLAVGLARDLAPIRVNAVCLGLILSEQVASMGEAVIQGYTASQSLPRAGTVEEAAEAYLYLRRDLCDRPDRPGGRRRQPGLISVGWAAQRRRRPGWPACRPGTRRHDR